MSIQVGTKVTQREFNQMNKLVGKGLALNRSDLLRRALREFIEQNKNLLENHEEALVQEA